MSKIVSIHFVKNEAHCINRMFSSIQGHVDDSYVLIDNTTTDNTKEICEDYGCNIREFTFENFGKNWNILLDWVKDDADWVFAISPDETINEDFGKSLHNMVEDIHDTTIDGVWFPRRHWANLEMDELAPQDAGWYPDWQLRLMRSDFPRVHLRNYVHEWPVGLRKTLRVENMVLNHFNMYYKPKLDYNFDKMNQLYESLKQQQIKDGGKNIWP